MTDGYKRVKTDFGTLKYDIYGKEAEAFPAEGEESVLVAIIASILEGRPQDDSQSTPGVAAAETEKVWSTSSTPRSEQVGIGGLRRFLRRHK